MAKVFSVVCSTPTLPITVVAPINVTSGDASAYRIARASSTPVSTSRINGMGSIAGQARRSRAAAPRA